MRILYIGDVMGEVGIEVVEQVLPKLKKQQSIDLVIAQAENVTRGKGILPEDFIRLQATGVDFCTGGNWSLQHKETLALLDSPDEPIIRPANYPAGTPGLGSKYIRINGKTSLVISLLGQIVGKDADRPTDNPLHCIDSILEANRDHPRDATIVNFHGDFSSEKRVIGYYLDGRVSAVIGDHWHVPTADALTLPKGTAHITDVGMCGSLDSSLGVELSSIIPRWRDNVKTRNILETTGRRQFNAVLVEVNQKTQLADSITPTNQIF